MRSSAFLHAALKGVLLPAALKDVFLHAALKDVLLPAALKGLGFSPAELRSEDMFLVSSSSPKASLKTQNKAHDPAGGTKVPPLQRRAYTQRSGDRSTTCFEDGSTLL
jgi:hypothetical protein